ncbi:DUF3108 domain-containing protein [Ectothiorhodospiraceae bacterium 2226]|nr:DUF3108 domain-containing protein [Ectothiorhodospiraceae bacterium 2226]
MRAVPAALFLFLLAGLALAEAPQPFSASYTLTANGVRAAESSRTLQRREDGVWEFRTVAQPAGVATLFVRDRIEEYSRWRLEEGKVKPMSYAYHQTGGRRERHREIAFDYERGVIASTLTDERWDLPCCAQDLASIQIALMLDVAQGKTQMEYPIADGRRVESYTFEVKGEGRVETPAGRYHTVRVEQRDTDRQRSMIFWLAPELGYLPVRIEQRDAERTVGTLVLRLTRLRGDPG